jgi:hypothetical protein
LKANERLKPVFHFSASRVETKPGAFKLWVNWIGFKYKYSLYRPTATSEPDAYSAPTVMNAPASGGRMVSNGVATPHSRVGLFNRGGSLDWVRADFLGFRV